MFILLLAYLVVDLKVSQSRKELGIGNEFWSKLWISTHRTRSDSFTLKCDRIPLFSLFSHSINSVCEISQLYVIMRMNEEGGRGLQLSQWEHQTCSACLAERKELCNSNHIRISTVNSIDHWVSRILVSYLIPVLVCSLLFNIPKILYIMEVDTLLPQEYQIFVIRVIFLFLLFLFLVFSWICNLTN